MAKIKRFDTCKVCRVVTPIQEFEQVFDTTWNFSDIKSWMLDTYCIDDDSIIELTLSCVTRYILPFNNE